MNRQQAKMVELIQEQNLSLTGFSPIQHFTIPTDAQLKTYMLWSARRYFYQQRNYSQNRTWLEMRQIITPVMHHEHSTYNSAETHWENAFNQQTFAQAQGYADDLRGRLRDAIEIYGDNAWSTLRFSEASTVQQFAVYPRTYGLIWMWVDSKDRPINTNPERTQYLHASVRLGTRSWREPQRRSINILMVGGKVFQRLGMYKYYNNEEIEYISDQKTLLESPEGKALSSLYNSVSAEVRMPNGLTMRVGIPRGTYTITEVTQ